MGQQTLQRPRHGPYAEQPESLTRIVVPDKDQTRQFGSFCSFQNRRNLWRMLDRLGDGVAPEVGCARRRAFVQNCAQHVAKRQPGIMVTVKVGKTREAYWSITALATVYGLDLDAVAQRLDMWLRELNK